MHCARYVLAIFYMLLVVLRISENMQICLILPQSVIFAGVLSQPSETHHLNALHTWILISLYILSMTVAYSCVFANFALFLASASRRMCHGTSNCLKSWRQHPKDEIHTKYGHIGVLWAMKINDLGAQNLKFSQLQIHKGGRPPLESRSVKTIRAIHAQ